ncbi:efflux RND transporter periplasmic adaptor subunit [Derxia gummosa]|uniref:Efflux RND transporter periplasmic adaptor subunit n=1 Tax=Derxia gummosa DSM 723 TaxID=1121388 RepID=A0A9U5CWA3_9BURK|nr:efflux RND transporter periplasmic adaptor subunit [Derxia gummosa]
MTNPLPSRRRARTLALALLTALAVRSALAEPAATPLGPAASASGARTGNPASSTAGDATGRLATAPVRALDGSAPLAAEGMVEAVRRSVIAAQVPGSIVALAVKAGDRVAAGQLLARVDARSAEQTAVASDAQVVAARAALDAATREVERQRALFSKQYISQAALDRAEAQYKSARAAADAQLAQAGVARTQTGLHAVTAPYAGVVAEVPVALGDMALPGRPLFVLYDPSHLRVTAALPAGRLARLGGQPRFTVEIAGIDGAITPLRATLLPSVDPATHTADVRLDLPATPGALPGMYARVTLLGATPHADEAAGAGAAGAMPSATPSALPAIAAGPAAARAAGAPIVPPARLVVPAPAVVRRAEIAAVYVIGADGRPLLRQVRTGRPAGDGEIEILSGVSAGERVALDPQAAARLR